MSKMATGHHERNATVIVAQGRAREWSRLPITGSGVILDVPQWNNVAIAGWGLSRR
jgi:hypothetical protein